MIRIQIETDNEAFTDCAGFEVARILRKLADKVQDWPGANDFSIALMDVNGNKVGKAEGEA